MVETGNALALIPEAPVGAALSARTQAITAWLASEEDVEVLREARRRLAYYKRLPEEVEAARELDIRAERRLGQLLGPAMTREQTGGLTSSKTSPAEQVAAHRARALAAIPTPIIEGVLSQPNPSRAKVMRAAQDAARRRACRMTVGAVRMVVFLRDGGCVAPRLDPGAGPCADQWGDPLPGDRHLIGLEMDYVRRGATGKRHELARDHVALCAGHHRGTGPQGGAVWATAHRALLRGYLDGSNGLG